MIAAWMLSAVLVGMLATAGAMAADRVFVARRKQTRFVWLAAMGLTLGWPLLAYLRARIAAGSAVPDAPLRASVQQLAAIVVRASESSLHIRPDVVLIVAWSLLSAILLARMFLTLRSLRASGRAWRSEHVDGVYVRLSRDVGPAVVGLDPMEVVLPEWALELEPPLRALVLAHEEEHRRARDPYLLLLSAALIVLVPWNPALWLQARRLRLAIELDCDARVLRSHPRPERYGLLLLAIAQRRSAGMSLLVPALSEHTSNLERRINAMTNPLKNESRVRLAVLGGIAVAAVVVACAVDAPVTPDAARTTGAVAGIHEVEGPQVGERGGDSTRGWSITTPTPDGKGSMTAWVTDPATGRRGKVTLVYDTLRLEREGKELAFPREEPVVEAGKLSRLRFIRGSAIEREQAPNAIIAHAQIPQTPLDASSVLYEYQVEKTAAWVPGTGAPVYPEGLKVAGIEGEVVASFVVDALGRADTGSLKMLKSTNSLFADAIRKSLPNMRFTPAQVGGRNVSQYVQQSFQFSVK